MSQDDAQVDDLRQEVAELREQLAAKGHDDPPGADDGGQPQAGRRGVWRPIVATILIVLAALLAPLSVVATWAHSEVSDTDRYVQTVAPLASDPAVQQAVINRITNEIYTRINVKGVTQQAIDALSSRGLPPAASASLSALASPLASGVKSYVDRAVTKLVESSQFQDAWVVANRQAHEQMVAVLTGKTTNGIEVKGNTVSVNLATVINSVKQHLADNGFALASKIPTVNAEFTLFQSADLAKAQTGFRLLNVLATGLPWVAVALLLGAVFVARSRRRALVAGALAVAASMLLLGLTLNIFRVVYLDALPTKVNPAAAGAVYDALAHFIRISLRSVMALFLVIAAVAWVTGPGPAPSGLRRGTSHAVDKIRHGSDRVGINTGPVGAAAYTYKNPIRITILGLALLIYVMASHPTAGLVLVVLGVALLLLLVLEILARPPVADEPVPHAAG